MPSTEDWRSALSRADASPRKPGAPPSLLSGRIEHLRDSVRYQVDTAQRRAESVKSVLDYSALSRASSPSQYSVSVQSAPRSPARSATATPTSVASAALVHPLAGSKPSDKANASPPRAKLYVRTTATPRQEEAARTTSSMARPPAGVSKTPAAATSPSTRSLSDSTVELNEIKQSVERLRAQRSHVEQLGGENQRLKAQLAQQEAHNERMRDELARVQGLAQENLGLLQTVKLLEERTRTLEGLCHDKRSELRKANEQLAGADQERQQMLLTLESVEQDHAEAVRAHEAEQSRLRERLAQLERRAGGQHARDREWGDKLQAAEARLAAAQQEHEAELEQLRQDKRRLRDAGEELEQQVQALLATTVRQTAVIEDCDRALSEARRQHASAAEGYEDQRRVVAELNAHVHKLEARAAALQRGWDDDKLRHEKVVVELESKLAKRRDKLEALRGALQDRDQQLQDMQRDQLLRDRSRFHSDEVNKELQKREQALQSEVSELRIALRDVTDEKTLLGDRVRELQERLETEQKDRQRWATARLKLLAEFCDEENKLTSALQHRGSHRRRHDRREEASSVGSAEHLVWTRELDASGGSDDSSQHREGRRGSIVFG